MQLTVAVFLLTLGGVAPEGPLVRAERLSNCGSWTAAIYGSGTAHVDAVSCSSGAYTWLYRLDDEQMRRLREALTAAALPEMPKKITGEESVLDDEVMVLRVPVSPSSHHEVLIEAYHYTRSRDPLVQRLRRVWRAIEDAVPEPRP